MSNTLKLGTDGKWAAKEGSLLAFNDENGNYKPLPFTFDRSTSATRVNKEGLIEVVSNNEPRIDFLNDSKGALLLEPSRSNLITYSEDFTNSSWIKVNATVSSNNLISPDGNLNGDLIQATSTVGLAVITNFLTETQQTISVFAKSGNYDKFKMGQASDEYYAEFDLTNGSVLNVNGNLSGASIDYYGNGWYRCSVSYASPSGLKTLGLVIEGNGNSVNFFGAQSELGSYATSYIPTQGSIGTRVAESCIQTNINTSIISSSYPFSMYVESTYIVGNEQPLSFINSNVANNYYVITINSNVVNLDARANGLTELISSGVSLVNGQKFKAAITMQSATSGKICVNGNTVISKTNFSNQSVNSNINDLLLGQLRTSLDTGNRLPITDARLYNTALTDQELINLTTI